MISNTACVCFNQRLKNGSVDRLQSEYIRPFSNRETRKHCMCLFQSTVENESVNRLQSEYIRLFSNRETRKHSGQKFVNIDSMQ